MLHHMCQNNIDHTKFDGGFEEKVGIVFHCRDCMSKSKIPENITGKISKPSNKVWDIIESKDEEKYQDTNLEGVFDDIYSSESNSDSDVDSNDDNDSSDNDSSDNDSAGNDTDDDDELDVVELDNKGRKINENPTFKSNDLNKNKDVLKSNEKLIELPKNSSINQNFEESLITNDTNDDN